MNKIRFSVLFLSIALTVCETKIFAQEQSKIKSGDYETLSVGVNRQGELTGYFVDGTGDDGEGNPRFSCIFFIYGQKEIGGTYKVKTWFPGNFNDVVEGELKYFVKGAERGVNLHLDGEHGGCWNVAPELKNNDGVNFQLTSAGNWNGIRVISAARAYFYKSANAKSRRKTYVVRGDAVQIFQIKNDWAEAAFVSGKGNTVKAWMRTKDFYAVVQ